MLRRKVEGQPPRQVSSAIAARSCAGGAAVSFLPASRAAREIAPVESPDSNRLMGRIRNREMRIAPECRMRASDGVADPVRMNCPSSCRSSTALRTASHTSGTRCHSSINRGVAPSRRTAGSASPARRIARSASRRTSLAACCRAVEVLPLALGPSMSTAPLERRRWRSISSTRRGRYCGLRGMRAISEPSTFGRPQ